MAAPFDLLDDWSGDVILNTNYRFGRAAGQYDLFTVLLQESGHALGLANSNALDSVMFGGGYRGVLMTIFNDQRQVVYSLASRPGEANSTTLLLAAGTYTVQFLGVSRDSEKLLDDYDFSLTGLIRDDPIGPQPISVIKQPIGGGIGNTPTNSTLVIRRTPPQPWLQPTKPSTTSFRKY